MNSWQRNTLQYIVGLALACALLTALAVGQGPGGCSPMSAGTQFADVTGSGRADLITVYKNGISVRPSDGSRFLRPNTWSPRGFFGSDESGTANIYFADVTGDGRADAIVSNLNGLDVRVSDGRGFLGNEAWTNGPFFGSLYGRHNLYFADVTGGRARRRADAIVVNPDGIVVRRSDGRQFLPNEAWTNEPFYGELGTYFADVDGDGRADAIAVNRNGITVRRSDGRRFMGNELWMEGLFQGGRNRWGDRDRGRDRDRSRDWDRPRGKVLAYYFADVNGDGKADAIMVTTEGVLVGLSDGQRFLPPYLWIVGPFYGGVGTYFVDVTGDGMADAVAVNTNRIDVRRSDGTQFLPNEAWTRGAAYGDIVPLCSIR
ncbi:MAG: VCBS repeat-containing protein [Acidobacteriia bacterium]|nr:VCBS repeat-containing protein [Terriglobia bacterium]